MNDAEAPLVRAVNDEHALWDAAYVLGSLSCADRREYETHLSTCAACRLAVSELCGVPGLLRRVSLDDALALDMAAVRGAQATTPIDLHVLNELVAQASRRRRRARMLTWIVAATALTMTRPSTDGHTALT